MLEGTKVSTSVVNGTNIIMNPMSTYNFMMGLAISVIMYCREEKFEKNGNLLHKSSNLPHYDELVDEYCEGLHGAVTACILEQNVQIIYRFVQEAVLNKTCEGLYLFQNVSKEGVPCWKLLTAALDTFMEHINREWRILGEEVPQSYTKYNEYNIRFEALMNNGVLKE